MLSAPMVAAYAPAPMPVGFWRRVIAYLVDAFLLSFVGGAFPYLVITTNPNTSPGNASGPVGASSLLVSFLYFVFFWSEYGGGRTLGMRLLGIKVIAEDGQKVAILEAVVRWIGLWLSFVLCFVGVIWVAFDARKQGWHDKMAHTLVVPA